MALGSKPVMHSWPKIFCMLLVADSSGQNSKVCRRPLTQWVKICGPLSAKWSWFCIF